MSSGPSTPSRPSTTASAASSPASRDGRTLEERTQSMDYDEHYQYKENGGKHYKHRTSPNASQNSLTALKDKIVDTMHVPDHAPHLVLTAADHRSRYLPGVMYVPMLILRWLAHPFRLLLGAAEDSDEEVHRHSHEHGCGGGVSNEHT